MAGRDVTGGPSEGKWREAESSSAPLRNAFVISGRETSLLRSVPRWGSNLV